MSSPEQDLIQAYLAPLAGDGAAGLLDDAAVWRPDPGRDTVVSTDTLVAGVHFIGDEPPDLVARKALRVNLSDLAAKGADPKGYLLNLAFAALKAVRVFASMQTISSRSLAPLRTPQWLGCHAPDRVVDRGSELLVSGARGAARSPARG